MSEIDLAYCAGLIDGEGCIGIYYNKVHRNYQLRLQVQMNDKRPLEKLYSLFGGKFYFKEAKPPRHAQHTWMIFGSQVEYVLKQLKPYIIVKDKQVENALSCDWSSFKGSTLFPEEERAKRIEAHEKMKQLNKRGFYG